MTSLFHDRRVIIWVRTINGLPTEIVRKHIVSTKDKVEFRKLSWPFDVGRPSFRSGRTFYYLADVKTGQLQFSETKLEISPELIDTVLNRNTIKQLVSSLKARNLIDTLLYLLMGLGMGIPIGYILGNVLPIG